MVVILTPGFVVVSVTVQVLVEVVVLVSYLVSVQVVVVVFPGADFMTVTVEAGRVNV